jgi:hypothetical protein
MPINVQDNNMSYSGGIAVTPHDTNELTHVCRAIYVGGAGNVSVKMGETVVTFIAPPVGSILPVRTSLIRATLTTATNLIALY